MGFDKPTLKPKINPIHNGRMYCAFAFFGSINLLAIGILGEYMAKILTEVKKRPKLIRSLIIRDGKIVVCGLTKKI